MQVDVNANHNTAAQCGVRSMPTFQFYLNGAAPCCLLPDSAWGTRR